MTPSLPLIFLLTLCRVCSSSRPVLLCSVLLALGLNTSVADASTQAVPASVLPKLAVSTSLPSASSSLKWLDWSPRVFERARAEHKLVLLDMAAVWCHWCHVMDEQTYANSAVIKELGSKYLLIRVDQDSRPDLANRYRDYGWPATILFDAQGRELVKRAGYIPAEDMAPLLAKTYARPVPEEPGQQATHFAESHQLAASLRKVLEKKHRDSYDAQLGGLQTGMKFLERDSVEYTLMLADAGNVEQARQARQTLDAGLALADPVWGGFYQYSTHGDWQHPHFEKIMPVQAGYLRLYALGYAQFGDARYAAAAKGIKGYLRRFLSAQDGAFYTSQDADLVPGEHSQAYFALGDKARLAQGVPRVDKHEYARENGLAIEALAMWSAASGDTEALSMAERSARWAMANRRSPGGGFRHDARDVAGPYLGDSLAMARGLLVLYSVDGDRRWLTASMAATDFIERTFRATGAGYRSSAAVDAIAPSAPVTDEMVALARHANLLSQYTGLDRFKRTADYAMRYLATPAVSADVLTEAGILLADAELSHAPLHLTVVSQQRDTEGGGLYRVALAQAGAYKRVEYWDKSQGPLYDLKVSYPALPRSAAFVCTDTRCSLPAFTPDAFKTLITQLKIAKK